MTGCPHSRIRWTIAAARCCAAAILGFGVVACEQATAPPGPPYLAIVTNITAWPGASLPREITYHVSGGSGTTTFERTFRIAPSDTVIASVPPGAYVIESRDLPTRCVIPRGGTQREISLSDEDNTGIIRYQVECRTLVSLSVTVDGYEVDRDFVYRLRPASGPERVGLIAGNDTVAVDSLPAGEYVATLGGVAANCSVISDGGTQQTISVTPTGGAALAFRVVCSDPARRPRIASLVSGFDLGAIVFAARLIDPDRDIESYVWDLTDCEGNSVLPDKRERIRRGLSGGRGARADTLTVVGAFDLALSREQLVGRCTELRIVDLAGNVSEVFTERLGVRGGAAPIARFFNAQLVDRTLITNTLAASDPDNDIVGHFVFVRLRDGVLGIPDGAPDLGSMDPSGYLGLDVPNIPTTGGRIQWDDVYSVIVCLIDSRGNVARVEDADIFR